VSRPINVAGQGTPMLGHPTYSVSYTLFTSAK